GDAGIKAFADAVGGRGSEPGTVRSVATEGAVTSDGNVSGVGADGVRLSGATREGSSAGVESVSEDRAGTDSGQVGTSTQLTGEAADWSGRTFRPTAFQARLSANIVALETLRDLDAGGMYATPAQQEKLAGWSSWGALPEVFDPLSDRVSDETRSHVRELLGEAGWQQAKATTL